MFIFVFSFSATFDRIAEINFNIDADDNSVSAHALSVYTVIKVMLLIGCN